MFNLKVFSPTSIPTYNAKSLTIFYMHIQCGTFLILTKKVTDTWKCCILCHFHLSSAFARKISIKLHACLLCETQHQTFIQFDIQIDKRHSKRFLIKVMNITLDKDVIPAGDEFLLVIISQWVIEMKTTNID